MLFLLVMHDNTARLPPCQSSTCQVQSFITKWKITKLQKHMISDKTDHNNPLSNINCEYSAEIPAEAEGTWHSWYQSFVASGKSEQNPPKTYVICMDLLSCSLFNGHNHQRWSIVLRTQTEGLFSVRWVQHRYQWREWARTEREHS